MMSTRHRSIAILAAGICSFALSPGAGRAAVKDTVRLARTAQFWPTYPDLDDEWTEFRASARKNEEKPESDPTRVPPGDYFQKHWVQRYKKELAYTSDKRYHYKGSGACYYQMGDAMGRAMLEMIK